MWTSGELLEVRKVIDGSYNIIVLAPEHAEQDTRTAQHILADALTNYDKNVYVYPTGGGFAALPHRNVTVSFDYQGRKIEKLQYKISDQHVSLTFTPFDGEIVPERIQIAYAAIEIDLIIAVGVESEDTIPSVVSSHGIRANNVTVINLDNREANAKWGKYNLVLTDVPLHSLVAVTLAHTFGLSVDERWRQMAVVEMKERLPALGNASPRLLRTIADLLEKPAGT